MLETNFSEHNKIWEVLPPKLPCGHGPASLVLQSDR